MQFSTGTLILWVTPVALFFLLRRKLSRVAVFGCCVGALIAAGVLLQKPWRTSGAVHVVRQAQFAGIPIAVTQRYNGDGLNTSFFLVKVNSKWQWYCIGNDDLYWRTVTFRRNVDGSLSIRKLGQEIASFDPASQAVRWGNVSQVSSFETSILK